MTNQNHYKEYFSQRHKEHREKYKNEILKFDNLEENIGFYKGHKVLFLNITINFPLKSLCPLYHCDE